jgi:hypothetical protein
MALHRRRASRPGACSHAKAADGSVAKEGEAAPRAASIPLGRQVLALKGP